MQNYATANTNQGLISDDAPAFHIFGGWMMYNYATLPRTNAEVIIKSGTYGRIVLGSSSGVSAPTSMYMTTSHNYVGSSMNDMFNITCTVDIKNTTTNYNTYDYDINLSDYYLTTTLNDMDMYKLPDITLEKGEYYILMASGDENLTNSSYIHTNFKISSVFYMILCFFI